jgi:hypothetical protein
VEKKLSELVRVGVGGAGAEAFRGGARGLSSSEPESQASSSAQSALDCAAVIMEKWEEGRRPR